MQTERAPVRGTVERVRPRDTAVSVRGLRKTYRSRGAGGTARVAAVDGLDLHVERGEIFAVLGPNGAGKTTTVEILEGFRDRDAGEVSVLGEDPARAGRAWRARIGVVQQDSRDLGELTVAEMVGATARYYPVPGEPAEVIEAVGLTEHARKRTRALSGGQRRRLDVALGIVGRPDLLFLDEPTTGFDPQARRSFWDLVTGLRDDGATILLTTHYLEEAAYLADRVVVIDHGTVVASGAPDSLGGPDARTPLVSWLDGGARRSLRTDRPTEAVARLAREIGGPGGEIPGLTITRPTLEDVYLDLIGGGRTAAEEGAGTGAETSAGSSDESSEARR
ncbi:ABC transporter ATP-binding protein [Myceligenerans pegani]|uniref:ABC transporter ATP-binding protein n=1 Tax=Myceligenerans pegani TaxID=2776917 RepID=A0ABR9MXY0_9MICO|nr:ABC transporter ATP-binding protein [Myceligenerans sp. TRM 65318]MBE1876252.1 ABC transporter ATP-binding protein [Myceligenerans sp. TRM 65318]MBE3018523.1 ABC transporter ATP-binding protein [Myceligenerans sp. TRM 65318]